MNFVGFWLLENSAPVVNHIWQSTVCVGIAWLLALALKKNRAVVRYWVWFAASLKFLTPFSVLIWLGGHLGWRTVAAAEPPQWSFVLDHTVQPFAVQFWSDFDQRLAVRRWCWCRVLAEILATNASRAQGRHAARTAFADSYFVCGCAD